MPAMICAPQPLAVEEGAKVLTQGGNAFDAALTAALVQSVIDPHSCGIGGYLLLTSFTEGAGGLPPVIDAPATAGSRVTPKMWQDRLLRPNPRGWGYFLKGKVNEDGYLSICTPGMVRGLEAIHGRWCTRSWAELFDPAIRIAQEGWTVMAHLAGRWKEPPNYYEGSSAFQKLHVTPEAERIYLKAGGTTYEAGEKLRNPDYARSLEQIARHGAEEFYTGNLGIAIADDLAAHQSWVTADDLAAYQVREEAPVVTSYRDYTIVTASPPHGGPTLAAILNILEGYDLSSLEPNSPEYIELLSQSMRAAFADRNRYLADARFSDVPLQWMVSKERGAEWRNAIDAGRPIETGWAQSDPPETTQVTVVDSKGRCASLTHSLGTSSGVITPGLGFMYNNSMVNFDPRPGRPNSIAPLKSRTTGMTPTVVLKNGRPVLVVGAPGATRIITSVLQVILNHLEHGMSIAEAVLAPRFDCQSQTVTVQARIPESVCRELRRKHPVERLPRGHGGLALVHAISVDQEAGRLSGAADAGADGMALAVP